MTMNSTVVLHNDNQSAEKVASIDDISTQILLKVPIKPLTRSKLVSKHWLSLISSHEFCLMQNPTPNPAQGFFLRIQNENHYRYEYVSLHLNDLNAFVPSLNLGFTIAPLSTVIMQCCNGLLLCCSSKCEGKFHYLNESDCSFYVYNPTTNVSTAIPSYPLPGYNRLGVTLVFDPVKSPYFKLVSVMYDSVKGSTIQILIYSSETGVWASSGEMDMGPLWWAVKCDNGVYWNGSVHFLSTKLFVEADPEISLRFHVDTLELRVMPTPPIVNHVNAGYFGESCGHLHYVEPILPLFNVYEMKGDYSEWFVKFRVDLSPFIAEYPEVIVNHFGENYDGIYVLSLVKGESEEDSELVLRIPGKAVKINLVDGAWEKLCDFVHDGNISCCAFNGLRTCTFDDEYGLDYVQSLCNPTLKESPGNFIEAKSWRSFSGLRWALSLLSNLFTK